MNQALNHLESTIKREITKIYKSAFGKGPDDTLIKVFKNVVFVKIDGGLTQVEQSLMISEEGREIVSKIRNQMLKEKEFYVPTLENIVKSNLLEAGYVLGNNDQALYFTFVFEDNLEI